MHPHSPKELECLGFRLGEIELKFQKGYMEASFGYSKVNLPRDHRICELFYRSVHGGLPHFMYTVKRIFENDPEDSLKMS